MLSPLRGDGWWQGFKTTSVGGKQPPPIGLAALWDVNIPTLVNFQVARVTPRAWNWEETHTIKCPKRVGARSSLPQLPGTQAHKQPSHTEK